MSEEPIKKPDRYREARSLIVFSFLAPMLVVLFAVARGSVSYDTEVNPALVNGILTVSAIIFGFSTVPNHRAESKLLRNLTYIQIFALGATGLYYFIEFMLFTHLTPVVLTMATSTLFLVLFFAFLKEEIYFENAPKQ